jgi:excinuclease ABC subunit A
LFAAQPEAMAQGTDRSLVFVQLRERALRTLLGHRLRKDRDAILERSLCALRRMRRQTLPAARAQRCSLHGKSIHEVLELTIVEAIRFFAQTGEDCGARISGGLKVLEEVGLGYLRTGPAVEHLVGRRIAAVKAGGAFVGRFRHPQFVHFRRANHRLHFDDVAMLLQLFQRLWIAGIRCGDRAQLEVIKCADWISISARSGEAGGEVVAGTPNKYAGTRKFTRGCGRFADAFC